MGTFVTAGQGLPIAIEPTLLLTMNQPSKPPRPIEVTIIAVSYAFVAIAGAISSISYITRIQSEFPNQPITFEPVDLVSAILPILFCALLALGLWQLNPYAFYAALIAQGILILLVLLGWVAGGIHAESVLLLGWAVINFLALNTTQARHVFGEDPPQSS